MANLFQNPENRFSCGTAHMVVYEPHHEKTCLMHMRKQRPKSAARFRLCFHYIVQFLYFLNPKFQASSNILCLNSPVCVQPGLRQVFSRQGSYITKHQLSIIYQLLEQNLATLIGLSIWSMIIIMLSQPYNLDPYHVIISVEFRPLKPHFYSITGVKTTGMHFFSYNIVCGYSLEPFLRVHKIYIPDYQYRYVLRRKKI